MKKIDFTKLQIEVQIGEYKEQDVAKLMANAMFPKIANMDEDTLVRKIYHAEGELDFSDEELAILESLMQRSGIIYAVQRAINDIDADDAQVEADKKEKGE